MHLMFGIQIEFHFSKTLNWKSHYNGEPSNHHCLELWPTRHIREMVNIMFGNEVDGGEGREWRL